MAKETTAAALTVRGLTLGAGQHCRVIVPITAHSIAEAEAGARAVNESAGELAELRLDGLLPADAATLCRCAAAVRGVLAKEKPLLVTIRTRREGGPADITAEEYADLCMALLASEKLNLPNLSDFPDLPDLIDVELSAGESAIKRIQAAAKAAGVCTVFSCHNFTATPPVQQMVDTLCRMGALGADIAKLAVMPHTPADAAALLLATAKAAEAMPHTPLITMSMGSTGAVTRVCGAAFGSCATFGTAGQASAPGQPDAAALRTAMDALQRCL